MSEQRFSLAQPCFFRLSYACASTCTNTNFSRVLGYVHGTNAVSEWAASSCRTAVPKYWCTNAVQRSTSCCSRRAMLTAKSAQEILPEWATNTCMAAVPKCWCTIAVQRSTSCCSRRAMLTAKSPHEILPEWAAGICRTAMPKSKRLRQWRANRSPISLPNGRRQDAHEGLFRWRAIATEHAVPMAKGLRQYAICQEGRAVSE